MLVAGAAKVNITPFLGGPMAGYASRDHGSESIHDELFAKALVLNDGGSAIAIITTDLLGIDAVLCGEVRALINEQVGIPEDRILVCASHTHFGPYVYRHPTGDYGELSAEDLAYIEVLARKLASAVREASDSCRPASVGSAVTRVEGISYNRRLIRDDGKVEMSLTLPPPYEGLRFGPVDPEAGILRVLDEDGDTIATLINFSCHPVSSTDHRYEISADYPGYAMELIEEVEGGICLFALGCAGNIVPIQRQGQSKRQVGLSLGGSVLSAIQWIENKDDISIRSGRQAIEMALRELPDETASHIASARKAVGNEIAEGAAEGKLATLKGAVRTAERTRGWRQQFPDGVCKTEIQVFWIGDLPIVGLPGEVFAELGMEIKEQLGVLPALVISLSNDSPGYIPNKQAFEEGGYESSVSPLTPGCGELLASEAVALAKAIR